MARTMKVIVTGDAALDRRLRALGDEKKVKSLVRKSMRAALKPMVTLAKANAPKDEGKLRRAIKIVTVRTRMGIKLAISILPKNLREAKPGQAAAVEFGTHDQAGAAPMRKAFDAGAQTAKNECLNLIRAGILDAAKS